MTRGDEIRWMVCADPDNDDLRLAYAVWAADDADPPDPDYGEFVRVQLEEASTPPHVERIGFASVRQWESMVPELRKGMTFDSVDPNGIGVLRGRVENPRSRELHKRERALLTKVHHTIRQGLPTPYVGTPERGHYLEWAICVGRHFDELARDDYVVGMDRGFVERVACPAAVWADLADRMYWHPYQTVPCPKPRDPKTGVYLGAGRWEYDERRSHNGCPECGGEGVVPRPCPPSANPIRTVVITTAVDDLFPLTHVSHQPGREGDSGWASDRWPGVTFLLRPAGYGGQV